jgi:alkylated DNA repair dioxygenase AlkB
MSAHPAHAVWRTFDLAGADVRVAQFCDSVSAQRWFDRLYAEIPWERHRLRLFGRQIDAPRLSSWIGDADAVYAYSGVRFVPHAWTSACTELREQMRDLCGEQFNSVLANLYRNGSDSMGWHSDKEPELGSRPCIASLSFGAARRFRLRHRRDPLQRLELELAPGSLLLMSGATQRNYRHDLPKAASVTSPRLNLTFRRIVAIDVDRNGKSTVKRGGKSPKESAVKP